jgi:pimeloyl-ACP methyl ester carboxylesterase
VLMNTTYTNPVRTARFHSFLRAIQKPVLQPLLYLQILLLPVMWLMTWMSYLNGTTHLGIHLTQCGRQETSEQLDFACRFSLRASPAVLARGMLGMFRYDAREAIPRISIPVLVITGNRDQLTLPEAGETICETVPYGERAHYSLTGHLTFLEKNRQVDEAIGDFVAKVSQSSTGRPLHPALRQN